MARYVFAERAMLIATAKAHHMSTDALEQMLNRYTRAQFEELRDQGKPEKVENAKLYASDCLHVVRLLAKAGYCVTKAPLSPHEKPA